MRDDENLPRADYLKKIIRLGDPILYLSLGLQPFIDDKIALMGSYIGSGLGLLDYGIRLEDEHQQNKRHLFNEYQELIRNYRKADSSLSYLKKYNASLRKEIKDIEGELGKIQTYNIPKKRANLSSFCGNVINALRGQKTLPADDIGVEAIFTNFERETQELEDWFNRLKIGNTIVTTLWSAINILLVVYPVEDWGIDTISKEMTTGLLAGSSFLVLIMITVGLEYTRRDLNQKFRAYFDRVSTVKNRYRLDHEAISAEHKLELKHPDIMGPILNKIEVLKLKNHVKISELSAIKLLKNLGERLRTLEVKETKNPIDEANIRADLWKWFIKGEEDINGEIATCEERVEKLVAQRNTLIQSDNLFATLAPEETETPEPSEFRISSFFG
jgi:hypothetical protein